MTKVDSKGRIVLPQELRERLNITPGTEVTIHEDDGRAVIEPEDDPDRIIERMERLVEAASPERTGTAPVEVGADPVARKHRDAVRRGAAERDE